MWHEFGIGKNAGEAGANIIGLVAAPELAEGVIGAGLFDATRGADMARRVAQGFDEGTAGYLSKRYEGMGDHAVIPRRQDSIAGIPTPWLKDVSIPDWIMNSPFNVSKPRGVSQGDFYEYHYGVDPKFYGARLPQNLNGGRGWSGKRLGLERYSGLQQAWMRAPNIYKDAAIGVALGDDFYQAAQGSPR
ncbi:MAG: hypothetical protein JSS35_18255 [Proteobacteria bacterium]|nr:hypothetical protein [Pseudomonadota bacterium]